MNNSIQIEVNEFNTIQIEVNEFFYSLWIEFRNESQRFGLSTRSLGHLIFWFAGTAQETAHIPRRKTSRDQDF